MPSLLGKILQRGFFLVFVGCVCGLPWSAHGLPWSARGLPWSARGLSPTFSLFFYFGRTFLCCAVRPFDCFSILVGLLSAVLSDLLTVFPFWSALLRLHNPTFWLFSHFGRTPLACAVRPFGTFSILGGLSSLQ